MHEIHLSVIGHVDSDDRERMELGRNLGAALSSQRIEVAHPKIEAPAGAKGTALEWAQFVLGFTGSLPVLIGYLQSWQSQGKQRGAVLSIEIDGDRIVLED